MKKICVLILTLVISLSLVTVFSFNKENKEKNTFIRMHIRANSNSEQDQTVKYDVKKAIMEYLVPLVAEIQSFEEAKVVLQNNINNLENVCNEILRLKGFNYESQVKLNEEYFPTRSYDEFTLESGIYEALIINLGSGEGNNWWCVVYPPLCFVDVELDETNSITYKSKILEIIKKCE